jgi:hypothetical protein
MTATLIGWAGAQENRDAMKERPDVGALVAVPSFLRGRTELVTGRVVSFRNDDGRTFATVRFNDSRTNTKEDIEFPVELVRPLI